MELVSRVARLEGPLPGGRLPRWARLVAAEVAAGIGLDPEEVVREAEAILARAERAGVLGSGDAVTRARARTQAAVNRRCVMAWRSYRVAGVVSRRGVMGRD
jgi:hypothetical protein